MAIVSQQLNEQDMDGKILRIKLKDFLTYDDCEFKPGDKLNVILGPNGTGKSSIVCAICLGLAGKPQLLGRAKDISDYVKHRKDVATIEIELYRSNGKNLIVKRVITRGKTRSAWFINGKSTNVGEVEEIVRKMNIQMGNLCQFLPQDRVVEFAKMNPQEMLVATEKAVGPDGMHADHLELIELRKKFTEMECIRNEKITHKERVESNNQRLERDVQRYREREKHQEKIQLLEKKKPWVEYEAARKEFVKAKEAKKVLEGRLKEARKINSPMEEKIKSSRETLKKTEDKIKNLASDGNKNSHAIQKLNDQIEKQIEKIDNAKSEFASFKQEEDSRLKKIAKLEKEIEALKKDYDEAPDPEDLRPQFTELRKQDKELQTKMNELSSARQGYQTEAMNLKSQIEALKKKLKDVENVNNQKLETLRRIDKPTYEAVNWLRENKHIFTGVVYEPILTQINMKDKKDAMYLESIISFNDMKAFVCQNREDQDKFSNQTRDVLHLNVSAVCPPKDSKDVYVPREPLENVRGFGFQNYMTDLFDAPKTVLQYLCENYRLHDIPIGNSETERHSNEVIDRSNFNRFFTPSSMYSVKTSKYSQKKSTTVSEIKKDANLLNTSVDVELKRNLDAELCSHQESYEEYAKKSNENKKEYEKLGKQQEQLRMQQKEITKQMNRRKTLKLQLENKEKRLTEEQKEGNDLEKEERKLKKKIDNINSIRSGLVKDYQTLVQKAIDIGKEHLQMNIKRVQEKNELEALERQYRNLSEELKSLEEQHSAVSRGCNEAKNNARRLMEIAKKATGDADGGELIPEALQDVFSTLPETVDEINAAIFDEKARLQCQYETNPSVIRDYEKNKKDISRFEKEIQEETNELEKIQGEINKLLERWLKPLERLIAQINEQYQDFFRRMNCAGQVTLEKDPNDDYRKYGVEIKVKFRAENRLKALTSTFQSGGERSVSTMLYLISLQELTKCPFRLVDEINQGMDPNNERRVFELVVETVCRPNTSQYFLITPKLLPDLKYTENMTILTVLNGHWMVPHSEFRIKELIERKRRLPKTP